MDEIKFSNIFLTQYIQNIISKCDQQKIINEIYYAFSYSHQSLKYDIYTYSISQFGLVTFQELNSHTWALAAKSDGAALEHGRASWQEEVGHHGRRKLSPWCRPLPHSSSPELSNYGYYIKNKLFLVGVSGFFQFLYYRSLTYISHFLTLNLTLVAILIQYLIENAFVQGNQKVYIIFKMHGIITEKALVI